MTYTALHGSPGESFQRFDPERMGQTSGYDYAALAACFTSDFDVAQHYADGDGFVGRFQFSLDNPLDIDDSQRPCGVGTFIRQAIEEGYDGVILRNCYHTAVSPTGPSDIFFVFDLERIRRVEVLQEREEPVRPRRRSI